MHTLSAGRAKKGRVCSGRLLDVWVWRPQAVYQYGLAPCAKKILAHNCLKAENPYLRDGN